MCLTVKCHDKDPRARAWATRRVEAEIKKGKQVEAEWYYANVSFGLDGADITVYAVPLGVLCGRHTELCRCNEEMVVNTNVPWSEIRQETRPH